MASELELQVEAQLKQSGLPKFEREHRFHPTRKWRFDFSWPEIHLALEIEGGVYSARSGHRSYAGTQRDIEKYNEATLLGWRVVRVSRPQVDNDEVVTLIKRAMK